MVSIFKSFAALFDYEIKTKKPETLKAVEEPYKFLPKEYSSADAVNIFGDHVIISVGVKSGELYEEPPQSVSKRYTFF